MAKPRPALDSDRKRVLIIEDDPDICLSLKYNLEREGGFRVLTAATGEEGVALAAQKRIDLVLLDLALPGLDGLEVCKALRRSPQTAALPIIILTARVEESDKVVGLELGADDYVTKPFGVKELLARIKAVLRRTAPAQPPARQLRAGPFFLDLDGHVLRVDDREVTLTRKEYDLLAILIQNRGRVLTRDVLLDRVWGYDYAGETRTVDVHVRKLRKKLGRAAEEHIETVIGVGYRFRGGD
jgi:two-component system alkaline phosphatase synthesis response regulator PhoP